MLAIEAPAHIFDWEEVDFGNAQTLQRWLERSRELWKSSEDRHLEQHPEWLRALQLSGAGKALAFELSSSRGLHAYAVVQRDRFQGFDRLRLVHGVVGNHEFGRERAALALADLLIVLNLRFPSLPVSLEGLRAHPERGVLLSDPRIRSRFAIVQPRADQLRYTIDLPQDSLVYFEQLGAKDRQNVLRHTRKLEEHCRGAVRMRHYEGEDAVQAFVAAALPIARMTYQYRAYNTGLAARADYLERYHICARNGWWRGHLLYCKDEAVAYLVGYELDGTYFAEEIGYNPRWSAWAVGSLAMAGRTEFLIARTTPPQRLDFGPGEHEYKRRLANRSWSECTYDLVPRKLETLLRYGTIRGTAHARALLRSVGHRFEVE